MSIPQGKQSLAETHPELAKQWSPKNTITPLDITYGSGKRVWWALPCGHEWFTSPNNRTNSHSGCPYCSNRKVLPGYNDLATVNSTLALEWSPKNTLTPAEVLPVSGIKVWWICENGHEWEATVAHRAEGRGCPYCSNKKVLPGYNDLATTHPHLVKKWSKLNKNSPQEVTAGADLLVAWTCDKGHKWDALVYSIAGSKSTGCLKCSSRESSFERSVLTSILDIGIDTSNIKTGDRKTISHAELDIYIPSHNLAVECNGLYWHSEAAGKDKDYHANKTSLCAEKGIRLLHIWEDEWLRNPELVKRMVARKLGKSAEVRVPARKTTVISLTKDRALPFLNEHHIQGFTSGTYYLGLRNGDELVAVMVLKRTKQELRLERYATSCIVQGGFGKMIAWIQRTLDFKKIITFADLCISDGGLYENNGWTRDGELAPDYRYVVRSERVHKFNYRLKRFREDPDLLWEEGLTEKQLAELNGIPRIWDCGKIRYVLHKEKNDKTT